MDTRRHEEMLWAQAYDTPAKKALLRARVARNTRLPFLPLTEGHRRLLAGFVARSR